MKESTKSKLDGNSTPDWGRQGHKAPSPQEGTGGQPFSCRPELPGAKGKLWVSTAERWRLPPSTSPLCEMEALTWLQQFWKQWEPISHVQLVMWSVHTGETCCGDPGLLLLPPPTDAKFLKQCVTHREAHHCPQPQLQSSGSENLPGMSSRLRRELRISSQRNWRPCDKLWGSANLKALSKTLAVWGKTTGRRRNCRQPSLSDSNTGGVSGKELSWGQNKSQTDLGNPNWTGSVLEEFMPQGIVENNRYMKPLWVHPKCTFLGQTLEASHYGGSGSEPHWNNLASC